MKLKMSDSVKPGEIAALCVACGHKYTEDIDLHRRISAEFGTKVVCPSCRLEIFQKVRDKRTLKLIPKKES